MRPDSEKVDERIATIRRITFWGLLANALLGVAKIAGGVWGHSQALIADGLHTFSDMITDIPILVGARYWEKPADSNHPHGHRKIELMVTFFIGAFVAFVAAGILINSLKVFGARSFERPSVVAFGIALVSIGVKELLYRYGNAAGKRIGSSALIANAWHHRSDALSSIPAALAIAAAALHSDLVFLDLIGAVVVSSFLLKASCGIIKPAFDKLTDRGLDAARLGEVREAVLALEGVRSCHKLRSRYIAAVEISIDIHVEVDAQLTVYAGHEIATQVKHHLIENFEDVVDVVVHIEPYDAAE